jgi:hypothetical protein
VYSTCLFCHASLGTNEVIEHFLIGRRLAFDAGKGRLWVVCDACERWNLTPLDERWEAIEECEREFRASRLRVSTDNVGLARLREGLTLVRIGAPQRPELAAWRYGDQFGRRRNRYLMGFAAASAVVAGVIVAGPITGVISGGVVQLINVGAMISAYRTRARVTVDGEQYPLTARSLAKVMLLPDGRSGFELEIPYRTPPGTRVNILYVGAATALAPPQPTVIARGDEALAAARILLPRLNARGGTAATVRDAVDVLERTPSAHDLFLRAAQPNQKRSILYSRVGSRSHDVHFPLVQLPAAQRLALEMSLHEEDERRALEGELTVLETRWKEAEEIAAISDDMFLPSSILDRFRAIKQR